MKDQLKNQMSFFVVIFLMVSSVVQAAKPPVPDLECYTVNDEKPRQNLITSVQGFEFAKYHLQVVDQVRFQDSDTRVNLISGKVNFKKDSYFILDLSNLSKPTLKIQTYLKHTAQIWDLSCKEKLLL